MEEIKGLQRYSKKNSGLVIPSDRISTKSSFCYTSVFQIFIFTCETFFLNKSLPSSPIRETKKQLSLRRPLKSEPGNEQMALVMIKGRDTMKEKSWKFLKENLKITENPMQVQKRTARASYFLYHLN